MIEVFKFVAAFCMWGLLALVLATLFALGVWCVVVAIQSLRGKTAASRQRSDAGKRGGFDD